MQSSGTSSALKDSHTATSKDLWVPEGFVVLIGPNGEKYITPEFMVPALDQDFHSNKKKESLGALGAKGSVSTIPRASSPVFIPGVNTRRLSPAYKSGV